jgi:hypothetical protein
MNNLANIPQTQIDKDVQALAHQIISLNQEIAKLRIENAADAMYIKSANVAMETMSKQIDEANKSIEHWKNECELASKGHLHALDTIASLENIFKDGIKQVNILYTK